MLKLMKKIFIAVVTLWMLTLSFFYFIGENIMPCDESCIACEQEGCTLNTPTEWWWWAQGEYPWRADSPVPPTKR